MKLTAKLFFTTMLLVLLSCFFVTNTYAKNSSAIITNFIVTVNTRDDGSLNMNYHVDWMVLDNSLKGRWKYIKVPICNHFYNSIKPISSNIENIGCINDNGSFIRIKFKDSYKPNDIISFDFSIHQSYMYSLDYENNKCTFSFSPIGYDNILINHAEVRWKKNSILTHNADSFDNDYLIWESKLDSGEFLNIFVEYDLNHFITDVNKQFVDDHNEPSINLSLPNCIIFILLLNMYVVFIFFLLLNSDNKSFSKNKRK